MFAKIYNVILYTSLSSALAPDLYTCHSIPESSRNQNKAGQFARHKIGSERLWHVKVHIVYLKGVSRNIFDVLET